MHLKVAALIAAGMVLMSPATAQVPSASPLVAVPGSYLGNYATPAGVVGVGAELEFVNGDIAWHDIVSHQEGPGDQPWCEVHFPGDPCPLLWSPLIPLGKTTAVSGTENLESGQTYTFYCSIHPHMKGTILVP